MKLTRREVFERVGLAAGAVALGSSGSGQTDAYDHPDAPIPGGGPRTMPDRVFFYDEWELQAKQNLALTPGPVDKLGPVGWPKVSGGPETEGVFCGSVVPMPGGGYRCYHSAYDRDDWQTFGIALAESEDGLSWTKPDLGQREGRAANCIWPEGMPENAKLVQPQVCRVADGEWRMWFWWHGHDIAKVRYVACESADGIAWKVIDLDMPHIMHPSDRELGQNAWVAGLTGASGDDRFANERTMDWFEAKRLRSNDAAFVYWNEEAGRFDMFTVWLVPVEESTGRVTPHDNAPGVLRWIQRRESADGLAWSDPEIVIAPDEHDPLHQQFYHLAVQPDGEWNLGLLGNYRCWEQTMDIELCFSRDTRRWLRPLRGGWIPRGGIGDIDYFSAYPTNRMIDEGETWLLLYDGGNRLHNGKLPEGVTEVRKAIMAARAPKGRLAGLTATRATVGSFTLKPFMRTAKAMTVDADVKGRLQAELRDPYDRPIPGFELNACAPVAGDSQRHVLTWSEGKTGGEYQWDVCGLRVEVEDGTVYSVEV